MLSRLGSGEKIFESLRLGITKPPWGLAAAREVNEQAHGLGLFISKRADTSPKVVINTQDTNGGNLVPKPDLTRYDK